MLVAIGGFLALWSITLRPQILGGPAQYIVVHGNSMLPAYHDGDLVILQRDRAYRVGDVVAYRVPRGQVGAGHVVVHRVVGGSAATGLILRGDNNRSADPWRPRTGDVLGSRWLSVPRFGRFLVFIRQPLLLAAVAALMVIGSMIRLEPRESRAPAPLARKELPALT